MIYLDIHTHTPCEDCAVDSRMSYRVSDHIQTNGLYSLGLHPCFSEDMTEEALSILYNRVKREEQVWAIGECGIDKNSAIHLDTQLHYFKEQIAISEDFGKPLIIHCVKAYNEVVRLKQLLKPHQQWIIHGFRKNKSTAEQLLNAGIYLSFGQYFNPEALLLAYSKDMMFLETDMAPILVSDVYENASSFVGDIGQLQKFLRI